MQNLCVILISETSKGHSDADMTEHKRKGDQAESEPELFNF